MDWTPILIAVVCALVTGAGAYLLARNRVARAAALGALTQAGALALGWLRAHPLSVGQQTALLVEAYAALPADVRARVSQAEFIHAAQPVLHAVEQALYQPPPVTPPERRYDQVPQGDITL